VSDKTGIAWTDATWNPVTGCSKVSPGCAHCYAEALSLRFGYSKLPWLPENAVQNVILHPERLDQPFHWRKPRRVFVCSMADLFHEQVPYEFILNVFDVMQVVDIHEYQILTKRPERMEAVLMDFPPLPNIWTGTSIENDRFVGRADYLRESPAAVRFISAEPLLGPLPSLDLTGIDWLIIGGESGPHARPMDPQWVRDLIVKARASGTAVFVKQMGGLRPGGALPDEFNIREWPAP
jgi:protein gp37